MSYTIQLLECIREMREAFKAHLLVYIRGAPALFLHEVVSFFQAPLLEPAAGCCMEYFFEISFKGGQASARQPRKPFQLYIEAEMLFHKSSQVSSYPAYQTGTEYSSMQGLPVTEA